MQLHALIAICNQIAPEALAEEWDNVGLHAGHPDDEVDGVLLCLDLTPAVLAEACQAGFRCLIGHHPAIFRPLRSLRADRAEGHLLTELIRTGTAYYAMHTNLDLASPGTSDALGDLLGVGDREPLVRLERPVGERFFKLVVFVPLADVERVRAAIGDAGAGALGNYSHCSFATPGTGAFRPLEGARPAIGTVGTLERVAEERLEALVPARLLPQVVSAMLAAHPYEEVAYDILPLAPPPTGAGLGRVGRLAEPCTLGELARRCETSLPTSHVAVVGDRDRHVARVALCGGSGGDLIDAAAAAGAEVLITGDVKHHQALHARDRGLALIDAGHYATERPVLDLLCRLLSERLPADVPVRVSSVVTDPFAES